MPKSIISLAYTAPFNEQLKIRRGERLRVTSKELGRALAACRSLDLSDGRLGMLHKHIAEFKTTGATTFELGFLNACSPVVAPDEPDDGPTTQALGALEIGILAFGVVAGAVTIFAAGVALGNAIEDAYFDDEGRVEVEVNGDGGVTVSKPD